MPFLFILIGAVMVVSAARNTQGALFALLKGDFSGPRNFVYWTAAIAAIGAVGYIPDLKTPSRYMMALIVIVLVLQNRGVFAQFVAALNAESQQSKQQAGTNAAGQAFDQELLNQIPSMM